MISKVMIDQNFTVFLRLFCEIVGYKCEMNLPEIFRRNSSICVICVNAIAWLNRFILAKQATFVSIC